MIPPKRITRTWMFSTLIVAVGTYGTVLVAGTSHDALVFGVPFAILFSIVVLGIGAVVANKIIASATLFSVAQFGLSILLSVFWIWLLRDPSNTHSDPRNDFKRFVMEGPHWADEDHEGGYNPDRVVLPPSVQIIKSRTFATPFASGEGAVLYFKTDKQDLESIIATDHFEPTKDSAEQERLNDWAEDMLSVSSKDLGPSTLFYSTPNSYHNVEKTIMAVNHEQNRAIFLYVNFN